MATAQVILQLQNQTRQGVQSAATDLSSLKRNAQQAEQALSHLSAAEIKALQQASSLTAAQNRAAQSAQRLATEEQRTAQALANTAAAQDRAATAALRRQQAEERAAKAAQNGGLGPALPRTFAGLTPEIANAAKSMLTFGAAAGAAGVAVTALASAGKAAADQARAFNQAAQDLQILAGSTARYNELLQAARQNQVLFGGSITDNLAPLQQLIFISNRASVGLTQLNKTASLLGATNSQEGIQGAGFAIGEFLSGDTTSIVERFNLPRKAINDLKNENISAAEKLEKLNDLILQQGDVAAVLEQRLHGPTAEMNRFGQSMERVELASGNVINALLGVGAAAINNGVQIGNTRVNADLGATAFEAYANAVAKNGSQIEGLTAFVVALAVAQERGTSGGKLWGDAQTAAGNAAQTASQALADSIQKHQQATIAATEQANAQKAVEVAAYRVASGVSTEAIEVARLARLYPDLAAQAPGLINAQLGIAAATDEVTAAIRRRQLAEQERQTRSTGTGAQGGTFGVGVDSPGTRGNSVADFEKEIQRRKDAEEAQKRQAQALESTAQKVARLRREEAAAAKGTAEQIDLTTQRTLAERELAAEQEAAAKKGAKASATRVSAAQSTALQLTNIEESAAAERERIVRDSQERLADMEQDYLLRRSRNTEDFERRKRRLLAEGKIFEARQAQEEFDREQRRAAEDFQIAQQRQQRDTAERLGDQAATTDRKTGNVTERAALKGVTPAGSVPASLPTPVGAPGGPSGTAPLVIQLVADGRVLADVVAPYIEARFTGDLNRRANAAPPQPNSAAGARP